MAHVPSDGKTVSESPPLLTAEPKGHSLSLPWHHLGGVTVTGSASASSFGVVSSLGSTLQHALSQTGARVR